MWRKRRAVTTTENLDTKTNVKTIDLLVVHPLYGGIIILKEINSHKRENESIKKE